jgi:[lysine-biosynthesis-protein LysW]--L-2-aminoadipate ligase
MRFGVVAHRRSETNDSLERAAASFGLHAAVVAPRDALRILEPGDVALGRLDVRATLDGMDDGETELERLAAGGIHVLNPAASLVAAHDKLLTARVLRRAGVPHPRTWHLSDGRPSPAPELPLVLKPRFGSWGSDVVRCDTPADLDDALTQLAGRSWFREHGVLAQELVPSLGWDLRLVVAGGRVVGSARRVAAAGEWRTNAARGAQVEPVSAPPLARRLALDAVRAIRADLCGVDLLPTRHGFVVLELNGAVDFRPLYADGDVFTETILALLAAAASRTAAA